MIGNKAATFTRGHRNVPEMRAVYDTRSHAIDFSAFALTPVKSGPNIGQAQFTNAEIVFTVGENSAITKKVELGKVNLKDFEHALEEPTLALRYIGDALNSGSNGKTNQQFGLDSKILIDSDGFYSDYVLGADITARVVQSKDEYLYTHENGDQAFDTAEI